MCGWDWRKMAPPSGVSPPPRVRGKERPCRSATTGFPTTRRAAAGRAGTLMHCAASASAWVPYARALRLQMAVGRHAAPLQTVKRGSSDLTRGVFMAAGWVTIARKAITSGRLLADERLSKAGRTRTTKEDWFHLLHPGRDECAHLDLPQANPGIEVRPRAFGTCSIERRNADTNH